MWLSWTINHLQQERICCFHLPRRSPSSTPSEKASRKRFFSPFRQCRWASSPHDSLEHPKHLRPPNQTFTISRATKPQQADLDSGLLFLIVDLFMALANGRELSRWVVRNVDIYSCSSPSPNKVAHKNSHIWTFTASSSSETFPVVNITLNEQFPTTFNDYCLITIWPDKTLRSTTGRSSMSSTQWEKYWAGFPSSGVENPRAERKLWRFGWQQNVLWNVSREQWSIESSHAPKWITACLVHVAQCLGCETSANNPDAEGELHFMCLLRSSTARMTSSGHRKSFSLHSLDFLQKNSWKAFQLTSTFRLDVVSKNKENILLLAKIFKRKAPDIDSCQQIIFAFCCWIFNEISSRFSCSENTFSSNKTHKPTGEREFSSSLELVVFANCLGSVVNENPNQPRRRLI